MMSMTEETLTNLCNGLGINANEELTYGMRLISAQDFPAIRAKALSIKSKLKLMKEH